MEVLGASSFQAWKMFSALKLIFLEFGLLPFAKNKKIAKALFFQLRDPTYLQFERYVSLARAGCIDAVP